MKQERKDRKTECQGEGKRRYGKMKIGKGTEGRKRERKGGGKERRERRENCFKEVHLKRRVSELDNINILKYIHIF